MTRATHPLGTLWVILLFSTGSLAPLVLVSYSDGWGGWITAAGTALFVTFSLMAVLFWLSELRAPHLPESLRRLRPWETDEVFERLGVPYFRSTLLASPFAGLNREIRLDGAGSDLMALDEQMVRAEANHLIAFVATAGLTAVYGAVSDWRLVPWFLVFNLLGNGYPVLLQRMNRGRIAGILSRRRARQTS